MYRKIYRTEKKKKIHKLTEELQMYHVESLASNRRKKPNKSIAGFAYDRKFHVGCFS